MAAGCTLSIILHLPHLRYTLYTVLIILSNSIQRLTFLPVYHHAIVIIMCCLWLQTKQSL
ncbi:hypothetical protein CUMW_243960, partial [Citrus unshiu]